MTRLTALIVALLSVAAGIVVAGGSGAQADSTYRVDAIFDTAKGVIPGQLVKIAGARVGKIEDVTLTEDNKARVQMSVESQFSPFRSDAKCQIQPEGLISENFVQCEPGTPDGRPLKGEDEHAPTVPLANTAVPVSLTDLFNIWKVPVRDRFAVVLSTLGAGAAGRGEDINALLRRASPTLTLVRKVTAIANRQRTQIAGLVRSTDRVVGQLARRRGDAQDFIEASDRVLDRTAGKREQLRQTVRRLPALLDATRPALQQLDSLAAAGSPLLDQLKGAAPQVRSLVTGLEPFSRASRGALKDLGSTAVQGRTTTRHAKPVVKLLRTFSGEAIPAGLAVDELFGSLRERGFVENLLKFVYGIGSTSARYDKTSHLGPARVTLSPCSPFATTPGPPECQARYSAAPKVQARNGPGRTPEREAATPQAPAQRPDDAAPAPAAPGAPKRTPLIPLPKLDLPKILDDPGDTLKKLLPQPPSQRQGSGSDQAQRGLLDFLLK